MKKIILILICSIGAYKGQVGIGTSMPDPAAMLHLESTNKGFLMTRVALNSITDNVTVPSPPTGLLVWNNGSGSLATKGFFYWNDNKWNFISNSSISLSDAWKTTGDNVGNFAGSATNLSIGTSSSDDFVIKTNNKITQRLSTNGAINIGENSSAAYQALAVGMGSQSSGNEATSIGINSKAVSYRSLAVGVNAQANANEASSLGNFANAAGYQSVAVGNNAKTNSNGETALGLNTVTNGQNSTALGSGASATGQNSTAVGYQATTSQANAIILGNANANVGIGTSTPNVTAKLDVNGTFKLGQNGVVQKKQTLFNTSANFSLINIPNGKTEYIDVPIPPAYQPGSTDSVVYVAPDSSFDANFSVISSKLLNVSTIRIYMMNVGASANSLFTGKFQVMILEY
ncbi:hypothetical protein [Epilithonimonas sp. UC225_85]|uniref:hypothetical protein n=1 Tax=Epilithonimonas sp. UC225_85 TaxID=3350167 RepID=UPI0036D2F88F